MVILPNGISLAVDDDEAIGSEATTSSRLGFGAKLCNLPRQVPVVNAAFRPDPSEPVDADR